MVNDEEKQTPSAGNDDDALRRQLGEQVAQLAAWNANKDSDESWKREAQRVQEKQKIRKEQIVSRGAAPSAFSNLMVEVLASALAYLTWIIVGVVVLAAISGGMYLWLAARAARDISPPIVLRAPENAADANSQAVKLARLAPKNAVKKLPAKSSVSAKNSQNSAKNGAAKNASGKNGEGKPTSGGKSTPSGNQGQDQKSNQGANAQQQSVSASAQKSATQKSADQKSTSQKSTPQKSGDQKPADQKPQNEKNQNAAKPRSQPKSSTQSQAASQPPASTPAPKTAQRMAQMPSLKPSQKTAQKTPPKIASKHRTQHSAQLMAQLKKLWREGANAKHRNNFSGARRAWQTALKLCPGHPGFQPSIDKLPRAAKKSAP